MSKKVNYIILFVISIIIAFVTYNFVFGKLFPYSPIILGFDKYECDKVIVFIEKGSEFNKYNQVNSLIPEVEKFHELKFKQKPKLFFFNDKNSYYQKSITRARFYAYPNGSLVISPWAIKEAEDGEISLEIYLKHELSHTLLFQHMGLLEAYFFYPRWLLEGIAVYSSSQMGTSWYPSKKETYEYIRHNNFMPPTFFKTNKENQVKLDVKYRITFMYSEFACIVDYLIEKYGKEKFIQYMKLLLTNINHDEIFKKVYKISFETFVLDFKNEVMQSKINLSPSIK